MFLAQLKNELWKLFGKKRTYIGFGAFLLAQTLMLLLFRFGHVQDGFRRMLSVNGYEATEYISALTVTVVILIPQITLLMPLYVSLVGGDIVAKESEDGTLRMILSRPISRFRLLFVKWTAGCIFSVLLVLVLGVTALIAARVLFPWKGMFVFVPGQAFSLFPANEGLAHLAFSHLFLAMNACVIFSVAFMFSCFNMKPAAATILGLSYMLLNLVLENIQLFNDYENWFVTHHFKCWLLVLQNQIPWTQIVQSELILISMSATAFAVGFGAFQVRDIKS